MNTISYINTPYISKVGGQLKVVRVDDICVGKQERQDVRSDTMQTSRRFDGLITKRQDRAQAQLQPQPPSQAISQPISQPSIFNKHKQITRKIIKLKNLDGRQERFMKLVPATR